MLYTSILAFLIPLTATTANGERTDAPFFNGKDLSGWEGMEGKWKVEDGALIGTTTADQKYNTFLCSKRKYGDFELRFKVRLKGGRGNSGVQIRSELEERKHFTVKGPQADIGEGFWGSLYGERFGGMMKKSPWDEVEKVLKRDDFNDYFIHCEGKHCTIKLNGLTTVDEDFPRMPERGIIAWQLHGNMGVMEVTFRDIEFQELKK